MPVKLEVLEERIALAVAPSTPWHFSPADNFAFGAYNTAGDPGSAGFNLVEVYAPNQLAQVPDGDKALVVLSKTNGADTDFVNTITPYIDNPKVFGFYLVDEPSPATVPANNLKAESDWIHANVPGTKTFFVLANNYQGYTPQNTDIDLVGLDPYPIRTFGVQYWAIPYAVWRTEQLGWNRDQIVPVYQAFGGDSFVVPTAEQEQVILALWGILTPTPAFDYAYVWGQWSPQSLVNHPDLQAVFTAHNESNQQPASLAALCEAGLERLEVDVYTYLVRLRSSYAPEAQQAQADLTANPWHATLAGNLIEGQADQIFASWIDASASV